jgi:hypothetical protein
VGILQLLDALTLQLEGHGKLGDDGLHVTALLVD